MGRFCPRAKMLETTFSMPTLGRFDFGDVNFRAGIELSPDFIRLVNSFKPSLTPGRSSPVELVINTILKMGESKRELHHRFDRFSKIGTKSWFAITTQRDVLQFQQGSG